MLVDDELTDEATRPPPPSRLELLALELRIEPGALRERLRGEVQRRLREKGLAWEKLDRVIEKRRGNGRKRMR